MPIRCGRQVTNGHQNILARTSSPLNFLALRANPFHPFNSLLNPLFFFIVANISIATILWFIYHDRHTFPDGENPQVSHLFVLRKEIPFFCDGSCSLPATINVA
jgi:hypothetical protein